MNLNEIRNKIDHLDGEILKLVYERMELGLRTRRQKLTVTDKEREEQVLDNIMRFSGRLLSLFKTCIKSLLKKVSSFKPVVAC